MSSSAQRLTVFRAGIVTVLLACFIVFATSGLFAQNVGFGSITGVVQDSTGAVVAGAKIVVENTSKGIRRELETSSAGIFNAPALVPASGYRVKVSKAGFTDYLVTEITVEVGNSVDLRPTLKVGAAGTEVQVTGEAPTVDFSKTDTSAVVGSKQILELPINGRRVDAFVLLTPGVSNDAAFGLLSFRGNPGGNSFLTDGVDTTNSYYDENAGRTRTYNISQDAVQEFQVVSSNYAAEFGKASGGVVNTVTRSGSNSFHGSAYEFYRNRTLNAIDRTTVNGVAPGGINPPEWRHQAGLSIGGPIKKDKLFFFFNGELFRRNAPIVSSNINAGAGNNIFDGSGNIKATAACAPGGTVTLPSGVSVAGPTAAQCAAVSSYITSRAIPQLIPRTMDNNMLFGKIDWHPTDKDSVSFSSNYLDFRSPNGIQTQLSLTNGNAIGSNADTNVFDRTGRASWTRILTPNAINEFRFGLFKDRQYDPASPSLVPTFGSTAAPAALTINSVSNLGYATNYPRVNPSELRIQFADNLSWTKGKHTLKFGVDFSHLEDFVQSMANQYPTYSYTTLTQAALDFGGGSAAGKQAYSSYSQTAGNRTVDLALWEASLFAQDEWHITPKLTLSPGIRFEHTSIPQPKVCNPNFQGTCTIPNDPNNVAPRMGFAYALNSKTSVRGGYGMFYNRYATSALENLLVSNGVYQNSYSYSINSTPAVVAALSCLPSFPQVEPFDWAPSGACAKTLSPGILYGDSNYRNAYSEQADVAVERELARNISLSVSYVWSRSLHIPVSYDTNVAPATKNMTFHVLDASGNVASTYTTPVFTSFNPAYTFNGVQYTGRVSVLQSAANSYYNAALVNLKVRHSNWFQGDLSYTYSHTIDWGVGFAPTFGSTTPSSFGDGDYRGDKGSSQLDRRHNLVLNYSFTPKLMTGNNWLAKYVVNGWNLSGLSVFASSQPIAPTVSGTFAIPSGTAADVVTLRNMLGFSSVVSGFSINGLGGSSRVPFESTSALNVGALYRTDARLAKTFPVTERVNVTLGFEAFNIFNHLIPSGRDAAQYSVSVPSVHTDPNYGFGVLTPRTSFGAVTLTQVTPDGTTARRAQALVRINF
jgi:outer membrane receptor protein involved in Fe transport